MWVFLLVLSLLATLLAIGLTVLVFGANMMSDAPTAGFEGGAILVIAWIVVAGFWVGFYYV